MSISDKRQATTLLLDRAFITAEADEGHMGLCHTSLSTSVCF